MSELTIVYTTARRRSGVGWFLGSLLGQLREEEVVTVVLVDFHAAEMVKVREGPLTVIRTPPKPTLWQGRHRVTAEEWWSVSNSRNTGLCLAETAWVAFLDDRCVLTPTWMVAVREAMEGRYAVFGTYEKRHGMRVEKGVMVEPGKVVGRDGRLADYERLRNGATVMPSFPSWAFGCSLMLPLAWALQVGGFEEALDGLSAEDTAFGAMLWNNDLPMRFDPRMGVIQDRTPDLSGPVMRREDKGVSPQDKSHRALELFHTARNTSNRHLLLQSRQAVLGGREFPGLFGSREDWWDGERVGVSFMR